ncbi:MAG: 6-bladed beta-propeller [Lachnospiraceae bacterium]|nr:6-bladed beta-propeller [Lachnospiraceae bacterium]
MNKIGSVIVPFVGALVISISGCSDATKSKTDCLENFEFQENIQYELKELIGEDDKLQTPEGIACYENLLYVADKDADTIKKYDMNGKLLSEIGKTGNGEGDLLSPSALAVDQEGNIYVAEEGNYRISIFNKEGKFQRSIELAELKQKKEHDFYDLEVNKEGTIFLTLESIEESVCNLYVIKDGEIKSTTKSVSGVFGTNEDKSEIFYFQSRRWEDEAIYSDTGYLGVIEKDNIKKLAVLPEDYGARDAIVYNNCIYAFNEFCTLDRFTLEGKYLETVFSTESNSSTAGYSYMTVDKEGNFYLSDDRTGTVYKLTKLG